MSKPSYYDFSQPEVLEVIIQNRQNEISEANARISTIQSELQQGPLNEETLSGKLKKYESDITNYESLIQGLTKHKQKYYQYTSLLNQANINITHVHSRLQQREKKLG